MTSGIINVMQHITFVFTIMSNLSSQEQFTVKKWRGYAPQKVCVCVCGGGGGGGGGGPPPPFSTLLYCPHCELASLRRYTITALEHWHHCKHLYLHYYKH